MPLGTESSGLKLMMYFASCTVAASFSVGKHDCPPKNVERSICSSCSFCFSCKMLHTWCVSRTVLGYVDSDLSASADGNTISCCLNNQSEHVKSFISHQQNDGWKEYYEFYLEVLNQSECAYYLTNRISFLISTSMLLQNRAHTLLALNTH